MGWSFKAGFESSVGYGLSNFLIGLFNIDSSDIVIFDIGSDDKIDGVDAVETAFECFDSCTFGDKLSESKNEFK